VVTKLDFLFQEKKMDDPMVTKLDFLCSEAKMDDQTWLELPPPAMLSDSQADMDTCTQKIPFKSPSTYSTGSGDSSGSSSDDEHSSRWPKLPAPCVCDMPFPCVKTLTSNVSQKTKPTIGPPPGLPAPAPSPVVPNEDAGRITTFMVCDLPCRISGTALAKAIESLCFGGSYDFIHLPVPGSSSSNKSNLGYGFINFISADVAELFAHSFDGYRFPESASEKVIKLRPARIQGLAANKQHFEKAGSIARFSF